MASRQNTGARTSPMCFEQRSSFQDSRLRDSHGVILPFRFCRLWRRATSSMNAFSHGLTAKTLILQNEKPDQFAKMLNDYYAYLKPTNQIEIDLIADMVAARWRR